MAHPTMEDVAARAGVSRSLVSLVMRDSPKVSPERRERVLAAAAELGYRPNAMARGLASRRTRTVGIVLNDLHNPFFAEIVDGMAGQADRAGFRLLLATSNRRAAVEARAVDTFLEHRVDGLVLVSPDLPAARVSEISRAVPVVVVGRDLPPDGIDVVRNDEAHGARIAVRHLAALGHERIAHIDGGRGAGAAGRRRGYRRAMDEQGLHAHAVVEPGDFTELSGMRGTTALLSRRPAPTAIFAANDLMAAGALTSVGEAGLQVPGDVSVVGYDNTYLAHLRSLSLTTIDQPREEMGRRAIELLGERAEGRADTVAEVVVPTLVVRETTGPPP